MNKNSFFDFIRHNLFDGKLTQGQVDGIEAIIKEWERQCTNDNRKLAYLLATAYHETGKRMEPVREGFAKTDYEAIQRVTAMFKAGKISKNYAAVAKNGKSFFGRGIVQLTWDFNYKKMGDLLAVDLYNRPELALEKDISARILVKGSVLGSFTGKKLSDYINESTTDFLNARKIINGMDRAGSIELYAKRFFTGMVQL